MIFYDRHLSKFFFRNINDNEERIIAYVKVCNETKIEKKSYFSLGNILFLFEVDKQNPKIISISNFRKTKTTLEKFSFSSDPNLVSDILLPVDHNNQITIGRSKCSITVDENSLSKKHCTLYFCNERFCWIIKDGYDNKNSTNGTWLWVKHKLEINETTYIKITNSVIKIDIN